MDGPPTALIFIAVFLLLVLSITGIWWLQSTMAARARRENPDATGRAERVDELEHEQLLATRVVRIVAPVVGVALAAVVVLALLA